MNSAPKSSSLQSYRLMVFRRALHPELFHLTNRRTAPRGLYDFDSWVTAGAHMMRFQFNTQCVVEVVTPQERDLPQQGLMASFPCAGERDLEESFGDQVTYITAVQTELLSDNLYRSTLEEMQDYAQATEAQWHRRRDPGCRYESLSVLDVQTYRDEAHTQSWHLDATCGLVVRTQAVFEINRG